MRCISGRTWGRTRIYCKAGPEPCERRPRQIEWQKGAFSMSAQEMPVPKPNPVQIFDTIQGYQRAFALKAAVELDLFTAIARGSHITPDIAKACKAAERGVRILSDAMVVMGFLTKSGNRYSLTPDTAFFLDKNSQAYMGKA